MAQIKCITLQHSQESYLFELFSILSQQNITFIKHMEHLLHNSSLVFNDLKSILVILDLTTYYSHYVMIGNESHFRN